MCPRKSWVHSQALVKQSPRLIDRASLHTTMETHIGVRGPHIEVMGLPARRRLKQSPLRLCLAHMRYQRSSDIQRNLILNGKCIFHFPVVAFCPTVSSSHRINELHADPDAIVVALNAALEHIPDPQFAADLPHIGGPPLVMKAGIASDDKK